MIVIVAMDFILCKKMARSALRWFFMGVSGHCSKDYAYYAPHQSEERNRFNHGFWHEDAPFGKSV